MDLVNGFKFFDPDECRKLRAYSDKKEKQIEKMLEQDAQQKSSQEKAKIPVTQKHHYLCNFFVENKPYLPRLVKCISEMLPHLEFPWRSSSG